MDRMTDTKTDTPDAPLTGHELIRSQLRLIDGSPGVYRMLDAESRVLYVGKARNLRARVSSYARPTGHSGRIARMIRETASMMFLTTRTETEALLLEQNLIKQLKPRYNVLLRDDKSFPNIHISEHDFPQIGKHRGARKGPGQFFGPFASAGAVNRTLNQLQKAFCCATARIRCSRAARAPACCIRSSAAPPLHGRDWPRRICPLGRGRGAVPVGQVDPGAGGARPPDGRGQRSDGVRARGRVA